MTTSNDDGEILVRADTLSQPGEIPHVQQGGSASTVDQKGLLVFRQGGLPEEFGKPGGLTVITTAIFLVGEMAGGGILALPSAMVNTGWIGFLVLPACCVAAGYNGRNLGLCWSILQERFPEYRDHVRYPYPAIGLQAFGRPMKHIVSICIHLTLFGGATVFILMASQNIQSLLEGAHVQISFCYWVLIVGAILTPFTWLGTPKDFWPAAFGAGGATAVACGLIFTGTLLDRDSSVQVEHSDPGVKSFFMAFGTILFAYGGASTFPTIQHDMRQPSKFPRAILIGFTILLTMYLPVSVAGYFIYGDRVDANILKSLKQGWIRITAEILITCHLVLAIIIVINPIAQELEERLGVPIRFNWRRCLTRTTIMCIILFVAESIPHFGAILDLVGGSTVTFLTFVAPSMFCLRLCALQGPWPDRSLPLYAKVLNVEIILVGVVGGVASTVAAIHEIASPSTFIPPCYINLTGASILN